MKDWRRYYVKNKRRIEARRRELYATNPAARKRILAANRAYRLRNRDVLNARRRARTYGTDGEHLLRKQKGRCGICHAALFRGHRHARAAHLDHDHKTGHVRGWLCSTCNVGLGHFCDNVKLLQSAVKYLKRKAHG